MKHNYWLIQAGDNPSADFFVRPELSALGEYRVLNCADIPPDLTDKQEATEKVSLVFVRYLSQEWVRWIEANSSVVEQVIYFMDDDLLDLKAHKGLSLRYRWKLYSNAFRFRSWLRKNQVQLWVSTSWLAEKYVDWQPRIINPDSPYRDSPVQKTVFYHGSASHSKEMRWLLPVIKEVLKLDASLSFEIIGDKSVRELLSGLPRVNVLHPMSWQAYKALVSRPGRTIGLAPLLDSDFNNARSFTKFFDITQAGAVGIYADHPVYRPVVEHESNGMLLPMDQQRWISTILELSHASCERERMIEKARKVL